MGQGQQINITRRGELCWLRFEV